MKRVLLLIFLFAGLLNADTAVKEKSSSTNIKLITDYVENYPIKSKVRAVYNPDRIKGLPTDLIIKTMQVKPGMTIVDIGAGPGLFTLPLAQALQGSGKVYATDIDPEMIAILNEKIATNNEYKNVIPVLVTSNGIDQFYNDKKFDLIFASGLLEYLPFPSAYFQELKKSLTKNGRVYIIYARFLTEFTEANLVRPESLLRRISYQGRDFPIYTRLDPRLQELINKGKYPLRLPADLYKLLAENFNKILNDPKLFPALNDYYDQKEKSASGLLKYLGRENRLLIRTLVFALGNTEIFNKNARDLTQQEKYLVQSLNRAILEDLFTDNILPVKFTFENTLYVSDQGVINIMRRAGYKLRQSYDFLPYHYFLEFSAQE